jgi:hypothetical protein
MTTISANTQRAVNAVSAAELQRRWRAVRSSMREQGIDALVVQNSSDWVGGYIRWFSNQPATNGYPSSLVFPIDGGMSLIEQGPFGGVRRSSDAQALATGITRRLTTPSYPSVGYTGGYDAELAAVELEQSGARCIGFVAPAAMYHSFGLRLSELLKTKQVVDATDLVDRIKAIKSEEERELIRLRPCRMRSCSGCVCSFVPGFASSKLQRTRSMLASSSEVSRAFFCVRRRRQAGRRASGRARCRAAHWSRAMSTRY